MQDDDVLEQTVAAALSPFPGGDAVAPLASGFAKKIRLEWHRNQSKVLRLAIESSGLTREDFAERIEDHPELIPLTNRVLFAAGMTGADETLRILAGFLGGAFGDSSTVDDAATLVASVQDFTANHVRVLEVVATDYLAIDPMNPRGGTNWTASRVAFEMGTRVELAQATVRALLNAGFLLEAGADGGSPTYADLADGGNTVKISALGVIVLEVLRRVAE